VAAAALLGGFLTTFLTWRLGFAIEVAQKGFYYSLYMSQFKGAAPGGMEAAPMDFEST
jgi:hypothetical protein